MKPLNRKANKKVTLILFGVILSSLNVAWAKSDMELQEEALKARESIRHKNMNHSMHDNAEDQTGGFRGVFYGYLPCEQKDCDGIKQTLSLKPRNNYLLVTQYAKESSREYYEKGKYDWDDKKHVLTLTPNKEGAPRRLYSIEDEGALVTLNSDGKPMPGDKDDYTLSRSDKAKTRQVHIH